MSLDANLTMATQVAMSVRKAVPRSANSKESGSPILPNGKAVNSVSWAKLNLMRNQVGREAPTTAKAWNKSFEKMAKASKKSGMGNCGEVAAIACLELIKKGATCVEYVMVQDGVSQNAVVPHVIAVIGRDLTGTKTADWTQIGLPDTWHSDAVICDPWARIAYPAKDFDDFWDGLKKHSDAPNKLTCGLAHQL